MKTVTLETARRLKELGLPQETSDFIPRDERYKTRCENCGEELPIVMYVGITCSRCGRAHYYYDGQEIIDTYTRPFTRQTKEVT